MAVPLVPRAGREVAPQVLECAAGGRRRDDVPDGRCRPHAGVEVLLGPAPEREEHAIRAVARDGDRLHVGLRKHLEQLLDRRGFPRRLREVVARDPLLPHELFVESHDDDPITCDPNHLGQAGRDVAPVVERDDRHRRVERVVREGQLLGGCLDRRSGVGRPLLDHDRRRLDGDDLAIPRLVGARAGTDVHDAARVAEGSVDRLGQPRVGAANL